jgi:hypothetical protein
VRRKAKTINQLYFWSKQCKVRKYRAQQKLRKGDLTEMTFIPAKETVSNDHMEQEPDIKHQKQIGACVVQGDDERWACIISRDQSVTVLVNHADKLGS